MSTKTRCHPVIYICLLVSGFAHALETDQFYAWGKPIEDSTHYLNAWVRLQIQDVLDSRVNGKTRDCEAAVNLIQKRLQHSIYQPIELWINSTDLVDRVPQGVEEYRHYRQSYLLAQTYPLDTARGLQPSPTLEVNQIRLGSDKLAHFFSEGWWYYKWWKKHQGDLSAEELQHELLLYGVNLEKWVHGELLTGIISPADMEANYQGFIFYRQMCHGSEPLLSLQEGRWHFSETFDISNYVKAGKNTVSARALHAMPSRVLAFRTVDPVISRLALASPPRAAGEIEDSIEADLSLIGKALSGDAQGHGGNVLRQYDQPGRTGRQDAADADRGGADDAGRAERNGAAHRRAAPERNGRHRQGNL